MLTSCVAACAAAFLVSVILYALVRVVDPTPLKWWPHVSLGNAIHISVINRFWGCNLVFYNGDLPYLGSIISFDGDKTITEKGCTGCGIYLRLIKNTNVGKTWFTLIVSLWYPIAIFGILFIFFAAIWLRGKIARKTVSASSG